MVSDRPNVLLILADQLAGPALPFDGSSPAKAPHLTGLARSGVQFQNAYCNSPLCAPSRFSLMAGRLPSSIGAYDNASEFPAAIPTYAHYLRTLGYRTCLSGKMHFVGADQLHGFEERLTTDIYPSDFGWTVDWERPEERPSWYHTMLSVTQAGICETSNQLDYDEEVAFRARRYLFDLAREPDGRPFFLQVAFTHPHDPYAITREYWERYDADEINSPIVPPLSDDQLDPHSRRLRAAYGANQLQPTERQVQNARRAYYGMISYIDDKVGELLRVLEATGLRENTIILFAADHGDMLGERGLWYKMSFFEWSARVPMFVYAPGRFKPRTVSHPVSLVDLLPTLVDLASDGQAMDEIEQTDGRSLVPLLEGTATRPSNTVLGEYLGEGAVAPCFMIRRGRFKYIYSEPDPEQLYDLESDPNELENLAGKPSFKEVREAFLNELLTIWDPEELRQQVLRSQRERRLVHRALRQGHYTPWDFQPFQDASQQYMRNHLDLNDLERRARFPRPETPPSNNSSNE